MAYYCTSAVLLSYRTTFCTVIRQVPLNGLRRVVDCSPQGHLAPLANYQPLYAVIDELRYLSP